MSINIFQTDKPLVELPSKEIYENHLKILKEIILPGDILLSLNSKHLFSLGISLTTKPSDIPHNQGKSHAFIYAGNGRVIESSIGGVQENPLNKYFDRRYLVNAYRHRDSNKEIGNKIVEQVRSKLGYKYAYWQIVYDAFLYLLGLQRNKDFWIDVDKGYACSELVGFGIKSCGLLLDAEPAVMSPIDFTRDPFIQLV